jgi:hypothetical protein
MLEKSIPHLLDGRFERTFHHDGIECLIIISLDLSDDENQAVT